MTPGMAPIGLVLAGGRSRRLGRSKAELRIEGRTLAEFCADRLAPLCNGVLVSIAPGAANPAPRFAAVEDTPPAGRGPLAGIHGAFAVTTERDLLVLACDYPHVGPDVLGTVCDAATSDDDVVMPVDAQGRDHPLVAWWSHRMAGRVAEALEQKRYGVRALIEGCLIRRLGAEAFGGIDLDQRLLNVNTPDDLGRMAD